MDREKASLEFLKGLKIVFNNASAYPKDHPYFIKSVAAFKKKIDELSASLKPIKINFSTDSLFVEGLYLDTSALHAELASIFHSRKIKSIQINEGITIDELVYFISEASIPPRNLLRAGGLQHLLQKEKTPHISAEEIDYSQLLKGEGDECKDVWIYLFREAQAQKNSMKLEELADSFERMVGKFKAKDIFEDPELNKTIQDFLANIKMHNKEKFARCSKALLRSVLKDKYASERYDAEDIKMFFKGAGEEIFAETLWEEIATNEYFDSLSFKLFSRLIETGKHQEIASLLEDKLVASKHLEDSPRLKKKLKELFSVTEVSYVSGIYRHALSALLKSTPSEDKLMFDRGLMLANYRLILLNLALEEPDKEKLKSILEILKKEFDRVIQERNWEYISNVLEILDRKKTEDVSLAPLYEGLEMHLLGLVEQMVFESSIPADFEYFMESIRHSSTTADFYINKIFNEKGNTFFVLKLFLKFFSGDLSLFYKALDKKYADLEFIEQMIDNLQGIDSLAAIAILKHIYFISNNLLKIEILRVMQDLPRYDKDFLLSILKNDYVILKQEALLALLRDEKTRKEAVDILLSVPNRWGRKNKVLLDNMSVIETAELKEAGDRLVSLSRGWPFWKREVRKKAKEVLKKWNVRAN